MNCLSLNIKGIVEDAKVGWVKKLKNINKINFIGIHETWMGDFTKIDTGGCCDTSNFDFEGVDSTGRPVGLLCIWSPHLFQKTEVIKSRYYLIIIGHWTGHNGNTIFANMYAPQAPNDKAKLWADLLEIIRSKTGRWVVFGDFNAVRRPSERLNSHYCKRTATDFNIFIQDVGLHDLNMGGHQFTYFHDEVKLSKLDRSLVCQNFLSSFPSVATTALLHEHSDHCPVTLISQHIDFGPPPFKFFNSWILIEGIENTVLQAWNTFQGYEPPDSYLAAKLRHLKDAIRNWQNLAHIKEFDVVTKLKLSMENLLWIMRVSILNVVRCITGRRKKHQGFRIFNLNRLRKLFTFWCWNRLRILSGLSF